MKNLSFTSPKIVGFIFTIVLCYFSASTSFSQKFGEVSLEEIKESQHPNDPEAEAAYLESNCRVSFDISNEIDMLISYYYKIKIYHNDASEYGDFSVPLYKDGGDREKIRGIKAISYNIENNKLIKTKLEKDDIFTEESSKNHSYKKFAVPNVKAGTVLEVKYQIETPYIYSIPRWYFQNFVPVNHSTFEIELPKYLIYTPIPKGLIPLETSQKTLIDDVVRFTFTAKDVPAFKEDSYVLTEQDYMSSLKYEISTTQFPNSPIRHYSKNWEEIGDNLMSSQYFGKRLKKTPKELRFLIDEVKSMDEEQKILHLYDYVRNNFSWDRSRGIRSSDGLKNLIKTKTGNIGDINLLLINLLKNAGIDVLPLAIKTRFSGILNNHYPSLTELNYLLAYVKYGDKTILLDASSKFVPMGQLPIRAVNINGLLIEKGKSRIIDLRNPNIYKNQSMTQYSIKLDEELLEGIGKSKSDQFAAIKQRIDAAKEDDEDEQDIEISYDSSSDEDENDEDDIDIENEINYTSVTGFDNVYEPIKTKYDKKIYEEIKVIGDELFIDGTLDFGIRENPFKEEVREYPVFYNYLFDLKHVATIDIPDGYELSSSPEKLTLTLPGKKVIFRYDINSFSGKISINYFLKSNTDIFLSSDYPALKQLFDMVIKKQNEKIVLKRI